MSCMFQGKFGVGILMVIVCHVFLSSLRAQSQFEATVRQFDAEAVKGYVQPIGDLFGAGMNAGIYHSARIPDNGIHLRIELVGSATIINDKYRTYNAKLPTGFVPEGASYKTATVFGGRGTMFKDVHSGLEYKGSDGIFNTNVFPLLIPQLTIGTFYGTEASVRYISTPSLGGGKFPSTSLFGISVRHSISQYFTLPIDISISGYHSNFNVEDMVEYQGTSAGLQISRTFALMTLYGGFAWETSTTRVHYTPDTPYSAANVDVTLDGGNHYRLTTGFEIDLQAVKLFADANFGVIQHFSGGIGFGF
jgi:hypothetical protein